jgi:hypothetical protein
MSSPAAQDSAMPPVRRAALGFTASVLSVLIFHQGMWALLYFAGLMPPPFPTTPTYPLGVPAIISACFWGGLYGAAFALLAPRLRGPMWLWGLALGLVATMALWVVVAPLKGQPAFGGFVPMNMLRPVLINGAWGLGVGLILPLLKWPTTDRHRP